MSFLSSILSTIGDAPGAPAQQTTRPNPSSTKSVTSKPPSANGVIAGQTAKRKADTDTDSLPAKAQKRDGSAKLAERPISSARPTASVPVPRPQTTNPTTSASYKGTARREGSAPVNTVKSVSKPLSVGTKPVSNTAASQPVAKPTTPTSGTAPKKGSYQEILARAKAQQAQATQVGVIKHKKVEKPVKKDKVAQPSTQQVEAKKGVTSKDGGRNRTEDVKIKAAGIVKPKKKAAELGYSGTMRPSAAVPSYKGTMKAGAGSKSSSGRPQDSGYRGTAGRDKGRYASYSDEEDEEEDYYSDASSDMEAGTWDVEEEENFSLRAARKEDLEAEKQEDEHRRQKELRRKQLAKMAAENARKRRF